MKKWKMFWIVLLFHVTLVLLDTILTYIGTPDLQYEANPLALLVKSNLGVSVGWVSISIVSFIWVGILITVTYYRYIKMDCSRSNMHALNYFHFIKLIKSPENKWFRIKYYALVFYTATAIGRMVAIIGWLIHNMPVFLSWPDANASTHWATNPTAPEWYLNVYSFYWNIRQFMIPNFLLSDNPVRNSNTSMIIIILSSCLLLTVIYYSREYTIQRMQGKHIMDIGGERDVQ